MLSFKDCNQHRSFRHDGQESGDTQFRRSGGFSQIAARPSRFRWPVNSKTWGASQLVFVYGMLADKPLKHPARHMEVDLSAALIMWRDRVASRLSQGDVIVCKGLRLPLPLDIAAFDSG